MKWFRMYSDFLSDPKMISLAFEDQRHFIGLLALKSEGVLDQDCDLQILDRIVAQKLWLDFASISDVKRRLVDATLIDVNWQPLAWNKRQMKSDIDPTNADRQRRYRENKKSNDDSNALRNGTVTPTDKIRKEKNIYVKFDVFWNLYPKKVGKQDAMKAWKKLTEEEYEFAIEGVGDFVKGKEKQFIKNPSAYLNGKRWEDEPMPEQQQNIDDDYARFAS